MKKMSRLYFILSILSYVIYYLLLVIYKIALWPPFALGVYFLLMAAGMVFAKKVNYRYIQALITTCFLVGLVCTVSYGLNFIEGYLAGILMSVFIYTRKSYSQNEKKIAYICLALVVLACGYFVTTYVLPLPYAGVLVGVGLIFRHWRSSRKAG